MSRVESISRGQPVTLDGAVPGELEIAAATDFPTQLTDAHCVLATGVNEAPRYLIVKVRSEGTGADASLTPIYVSFWDVDVEKWHATAAIMFPGVDTLSGQASQIAKLDVPEGSTAAYFYIPVLEADVTLQITARIGN